jgi:anti-anti-sigma factor
MLKVDAKKLETVTILSLQGEIVTGQAEILCKVVQSLSGTNAVILDLAQVSKVDAHGLGVLLEVRGCTQASGKRFELMNVSEPLQMLLEITRLDSVFQITSGVEFFPSISAEQREPAARLKSCA